MDKQEVKYINMLFFFVCEYKFVEVYLFIDLFCKDCWEIEFFIIKLWFEYGKYFFICYIVIGKVDGMNVFLYKWNKFVNI